MPAPDENVELTQEITAAFTGIAGLRQFAHSHPAVSPGDSPLVAVFAAGTETQASDGAGRSIEIKRLVVTGTSKTEAMQNARTIWDKLIDEQFATANFIIALRPLDKPSWQRQENDVHFANMRFRAFVVQTAGV